MTYDRRLIPGFVDTGSEAGKARLEMLNVGNGWMELNVLSSAALRPWNEKGDEEHGISGLG